MNYFIKTILLMFLLINSLNANNITKEAGASKKVAHTIPINLNSLNQAVIQLQKTPLDSEQLAEIYEKYDDAISHQETVTFSLGRLFQSQVTCEGIKATLADVIPVMIDILKTALEQIPAYALKQIVGYDITTPAGFAEFVVDMASGVVCSGYSLTVIVSEEALRTTVDVIDKSMLTFSTECEKQNGTVQGGAGEANENRCQRPAVNKNAAERSTDALAESAAEEFSSKLNDCMDSMKKMYNEVITAKIKNFTPYKKERQKSFCEMAKTWEKKSPAKEMAIQSPIRFHAVDFQKRDKNAKKKKHNICNKNPFLKVCKVTDEETEITGSVKLNTEAINKMVADKEKVLNVSRDIPSTALSRDIIDDGLNIINILNECLNDPTAIICQRISCTGVGSMDADCQATAPAIPIRMQHIPFSFAVPVDPQFDLQQVDSLLLKMRMKKLICLKADLMLPQEKENFIQALNSLVNPNYVKLKNTHGEILFDEIFKKEFCNYQFDQQINHYEKFTRRKFREIENELAKSKQKKQVTFSKAKTLKADFSHTMTGLENIEDMCTWFESDGSDLNQDYTSILYKDPATGTQSIQKKRLTSLPMAHIAHTQPSFPVYGVCADASCSKMNCVYDCINWKCPNTDGPFSATDLNNDNFSKALQDYKAKQANKKYAPDEVRAKKTATEYVDELEAGRFKKYEKAYNLFHNYESKYSRKVMLPMLRRQELEDALFIY